MTSKFIAEYLHLMPDVFEGVNSLDDLQKKIKKMVGHPSYAHFSGFLWEYVVAMYFYKFGEHDTVNVCDYRQTYAGSHGDDADYGLDGYGVDHEGRKILCQVKYRADPKNRIAKSKISTLDTFVQQIVENAENENGEVIVLLCTTSNEFINPAILESMAENGFTEAVGKMVLAKNAKIQNLKFLVYDVRWWRDRLGNPRFWNFVRSDVQRGQ